MVDQRSGKWWTASMPSFPGAYSQGRTQAEAHRNLLLAIKDLIDAHVQLARPAAGRPRRERVRTARVEQPSTARNEY